LLPETSNLLKDNEFPSKSLIYTLFCPLETTANAAFFEVLIVANPSESVLVDSISCC
jgi:hypothetical protein